MQIKQQPIPVSYGLVNVLNTKLDIVWVYGIRVIINIVAIRRFII